MKMSKAWPTFIQGTQVNFSNSFATGDNSINIVLFLLYDILNCKILQLGSVTNH